MSCWRNCQGIRLSTLLAPHRPDPAIQGTFNSAANLTSLVIDVRIEPMLTVTGQNRRVFPEMSRFPSWLTRMGSLEGFVPSI